MDIFRVAFLNFWNLGVLWTFLGAREARPRKIVTNYQTKKKHCAPLLQQQVFGGRPSEIVYFRGLSE